MIGERERRVLAATERQIRLEDPELAGRFDSALGTRARQARRATTTTVITVLLLLPISDVALGLGLAEIGFLALAATSIYALQHGERKAGSRAAE